MKVDNILQAIGKTPLVRLKKLYVRDDVEIYAKCEFVNPGGSVKDRIAYQMIKDAEEKGVIKPGDTLIEATSGNTGIGLALAGAVLGYKVIITMPQKMSHEKQVTIEALGAEIIRTRTEAAWNDEDSHLSIAKKLARELPRAFLLDQYSNPSCWQAHYKYTANEIIEDLGCVPDYFIAGAGTGGSISGIGKRFKEVNSDCKIIGCDPVGSILGGGTTISPYQVEGIGYDFVPQVLQQEYIDKWVKVPDEPSFTWARRAIRLEGVLCGGSCGTALAGLNEVLHEIPSQAKVVVLLPDGIRNYMTKMMDNEWLKKYGFHEACLPTNSYSGKDSSAT